MTRTYDITLAVFLYLSAATNTSSAHEGKIAQTGFTGGTKYSLYHPPGTNTVLPQQARKLPCYTRYNHDLQKAEDKKELNVAGYTFSDTINSMH